MLLEFGDVKEGCFEVKEDVKCLTNVRAARMFPFCRYLKIGRLSEFFGVFWKANEGRTAEYHGQQKCLDSFQQTNLPSSLPKPSHYPVSRLPGDEVLPR